MYSVSTYLATACMCTPGYMSGNGYGYPNSCVVCPAGRYDRIIKYKLFIICCLKLIATPILN